MDVDVSPRSGGSTPVLDENGRGTPVMDEMMEGGGTPVQDEGGATPVQDEGGATPIQDEMRFTPLRDEPSYLFRGSPQYGTDKKCSTNDVFLPDTKTHTNKFILRDKDAEMESDNEIDRGGGGMLGNNDDEYVSDGGEVEREEVEQDDTGPQSPASGPASPKESPPGSPDVNMSPRSPVESPKSVHSRSQSRSPEGSPKSVHSGSGPQSPVPGSHVGSPTGSGSPPGSPTGGASPRSVRSGSPRSRSGSRSRSASPGRSRSRSKSPTRSQSGSPARSRSGSQRSRSGSPRSRSGSPARSRSGSARSRSGSPARSRSGSARSRSGSPARSRSGSARSRSGSPTRSRSGSARSRSGSPARSRSGSARSRSGSPVRSRSGSPRSRSGSPARSRSGSPRSRSGSRSRSRSRSGSPARSKSRSRSRSRSASPGRSGRASPAPGSDSEDEGKTKKKKGSDDEDDSDKESEVGELIADIFGSSDEEEEFEGFDKTDIEAANKKKEKKKSAAIVSDDDDDEGDKTTGQADGQDVPALSDDEDGGRQSGRDGEDFVSDFDLMMERKKAEQRKQRRKKKNEEFINDNDDLIADMICKMKEAAEQDRELNRAKKPAIKKLKYLPAVTSQLRKADLQEAFLDQGILNVMTEWLAPLPDKSLPHLQIREIFLKLLQEFPPVNSDSLKSSGIGKAVMYLYKHPRESKENREKSGKLVNEWSRPIFSLTANHKSMSKEEREQRDYDHLPKRRRISLKHVKSAEGMAPKRDIDNALAEEDKTMRPGEKGFVMRARVPMPSNKDYVVRPKWNSEYEMETKTSRGKKDISRYERHVRAFADKKKFGKTQRAVAISIEGKNMAL